MSRAELLKVIILNDISSPTGNDLKIYQRKMITLLNMEKTELRDYIKSNNIDMDIISKLVCDDNTNTVVNDDKTSPILDTPKFTPPPAFPNTTRDILFRFNEYNKEYFKSNLTDERIVILFCGVCDSNIHTTSSDLRVRDSVVSNIISFLGILGEEYIKKYTDFILKNRVDERLNVLEPYNKILIHFGQGSSVCSDMASLDKLIYGEITIEDVPKKYHNDFVIKLEEYDYSSIPTDKYEEVVSNITKFVQKVCTSEYVLLFSKNLLKSNMNKDLTINEPVRSILIEFKPIMTEYKNNINNN